MMYIIRTRIIDSYYCDIEHDGQELGHLCWNFISVRKRGMADCLRYNNHINLL